MCGGRETPTNWRPFSREELEILRRAHAKNLAIRAKWDAEEFGRKPPQSVPGFKRANEFTVESLLQTVKKEKTA